MLKFIINPNQPQAQSIELESGTVLIGSSSENDLTISDPTISSHHCRIEESETGFQIVNLSGEKNLKVDGEIVEKKNVLPTGSIIELGDVKILFKGKASSGNSDKFSGQIVTADNAMDENALIVSEGTTKKYLPSDVFIQPITLAPEKASAGMLPLLSLILSILGPVLFGIGFILWSILDSPPVFFWGISLFLLLIGIVFGFLSRALIRRRGGFLRDQQVASWGLYMSFGWLVIFAGILSFFGYSNNANIRIEKNEEKIKSVLMDIAASQAYIKHSILIDDDKDLTGEYANLNQLLAVKYSRIPKNIPPNSIIHGYKLAFHHVGEDGFMVTAVPEKYNNTGRFSFYIDQEGFLRGEDIGGKDPAGYSGKTALAKLSQEKSVYELFKEELAGDIFKIVEDEMRLAETDRDKRIEHLSRAEAIVVNIRKYFPMSGKTASLDAVSNITEPVIINYRANEDYRRAMSFLDENKPLRALEALKNIETKYPLAENIVDVREKIAEIQEKYLKELEAEAKSLYEEAKKLEADGDLVSSIEIYKKIRDKYDRTSYSKEMEPLIESVQAKIKEKEASKYISELRTLSLDRDYEKITGIIELINRGYANTEVYSKNEPYLAEFSKKAHALTLAVEGIQNYEKKDFRAALQIFQRAMDEYPDVYSKIKKYVEDCYLWNGKYALDEKDYRKALDYFTAYRRSNPEMTKQQNDYILGALNKAYYEVGRLDYQQGDFEQAENKLFIAAQTYGKDPEFNYIYGSVLLNRGQFRKAIDCFTISMQNKNLQVKSLVKRGYSSIEYGFSLENKLRDILVADEEYKYLLDVDKIREGKRTQNLPSENTEQDNLKKQDSDKEEKSKFQDEKERMQDQFRKDRTDSGFIQRMAGMREKQLSDSRIQSQEGKKEEPVYQNSYPLLRMLTLIEEIEKGKDAIAKEEAELQGDKQKKEQLLLRKTRIIEEYQAKYAAIKVSLDNSIANKQKILNGIKAVSGCFSSGAEDLKIAAQLSMRNREIDELLVMIKTKTDLYNSSYNRLFSALENEMKLQNTTIQNFGIALDQFKGWGKRIDISRNLKYAYFISPTKEAIAKGLDELSNALDITFDTKVILNASGIDNN